MFPEPRGVELPLDLFFYLAGVQYPVPLNDLIFFRGHSTLLFPVGVYDNHVQWHLKAIESPELSDCPSTLDSSLQNIRREDVRLDLDSLHRMRHFVGYCPEARIQLGTADADYNRYAESRTRIEHSSFQMDGFTASIGTEGMSIFVSVMASFFK